MEKSILLNISRILHNSNESLFERAAKFYKAVENDPLKVLDALQKLMHTPMQAIYPFMGRMEALARLLNIKQYEDEPLHAYGDRFKPERQIVLSLTRKEFLEEFIKNTDDYQGQTDNDERVKLLDGAFEKSTTTIFLRGSYQKRYGSLMDNYRSQYAGGRDNYPAKFEGAMDALRTHKPDDRRNNKSSDNNNHNKKDDTKNEGENVMSFAQRSSEANNIRRVCLACKSKDHMLNECPHRDDIPRNKWFDRTKNEYNHHQNKKEDDETSIANRVSMNSNKSNRSSSNKWVGTQVNSEINLNISTNNKANSDKIVILDSGSTISLFKSKNLVRNIREAPNKIELDTNAGSRIVDQVGDIDGLSTVYFHENGIANIFALKDLRKKYQVTYDSKKEDAFVVNAHERKSSLL